MNIELSGVSTKNWKAPPWGTHQVAEEGEVSLLSSVKSARHVPTLR